MREAMVTETSTPEPRIPLSRDRVLQAAIALADAQGIEALTMRNLAAELGVEAMSIYYHVANKEALLDGVVDTLVAEVEQDLTVSGVEAGAGWKRVLRHRILTARRVMLRHPWAPRLVETRTRMSAAMIKYHDTLLGILVDGGFSYDLAHHAMHAIGSRALGFSQELFVPDESDPGDGGASALAEMAAEVPHIVGMLSEITHDDPDSTLGWCDDQTEFEFGLDLLLDGLERRLGGD